MAAGDQLRVGVVLDERDVRRWHETAMDEIERLGFCEVIVLTREPDGGRIDRGWRDALYRAYERVDRRVFGSDDDPIARVPLRRPGVPLGEIASQDLDVVLCLTPQAAPGELAGLRPPRRLGSVRGRAARMRRRGAALLADVRRRLRRADHAARHDAHGRRAHHLLLGRPVRSRLPAPQPLPAPHGGRLTFPRAGSEPSTSEARRSMTRRRRRRPVDRGRPTP